MFVGKNEHILVRCMYCCLQGFEKHVRHDHNMWNYIYYYVYVSRIDPRDRSAIQKYVHDKVIASVNLFPFQWWKKEGTLILLQSMHTL